MVQSHIVRRILILHARNGGEFCIKNVLFTKFNFTFNFLRNQNPLQFIS